VFSVVTENGHKVTLRLQRSPTHVLPFDHSFPPAPALGVCILTFSSVGLWQSVPPARVTYMPARVAHMFSGLEKRSLSAIFFGRVRMDYAHPYRGRRQRSSRQGFLRIADELAGVHKATVVLAAGSRQFVFSAAFASRSSTSFMMS
jgi:hypothetical protein